MLLRRIAVLAALGALLLPAVARADGTHLVQPGETLWGIAVANGLPTATLAAANGLSPEAQVVSGTTLKVPAPGTSAPALTSSYLVQDGDSISVVAERHGVSATALAAANDLDVSGWLLRGSTIHIPAAGTAIAAGAPRAIGAYTVRPGDTLSGLAVRSGVPMAQMAFMNGIDPDDALLIGTVLKLPTGAHISSSSPAPATTVVPDANPLATEERLTASQVTAIANEHGVPASLVAAIAWQESGFNNAMISAANARGIMQLLPGTWDWVQDNLTSNRLNPASAIDNVRAGALYLGRLLRQTNGDAELAAAGYYQGLASVERVGMLPDTRQYVANVMALRSRFGG